jgi:hypothetical protein
MPQLNGRGPIVYLYTDDEGVESLCAQTTDRVETELTKSHSKEGRGEVQLKVGFGNLLTTLLGPKEAAGGTKLENGSWADRLSYTVCPSEISFSIHFPTNGSSESAKCRQCKRFQIFVASFPSFL